MSQKMKTPIEADSVMIDIMDEVEDYLLAGAPLAHEEITQCFLVHGIAREQAEAMATRFIGDFSCH